MDNSKAARNPEELRREFEKLATKKYAEGDTNQRQERGLSFEALIQELFDFHHLLVRYSYHTSDNLSEQIDGAICIDRKYALLECKWTEASSAASDLFAFLGKVEGKFHGTIGIFISRNKLSDNFLSALRSGRRQSILVLHGNDIDMIFEKDFDLRGYLTAYLERVSIDNVFHYKASDYQSDLEAKDKLKTITSVDNADPVTKSITKCLSDPRAKNIAHELAGELSDIQRGQALDMVIDMHDDIPRFIYPLGEEWKSENLRALAAELVSRLPAKQIPVDITFFKDHLSMNFLDGTYQWLTQLLAPRYAYIRGADKQKIEDRLLKQWNDHLGDYDDENAIAQPTGELWNDLGLNTRRHLLNLFLDILLSDRKSTFPQYQLAYRELKAEYPNPNMRNLILQMIDERIKKSASDWIGPNELPENTEFIINVVSRPFLSLSSIITDIGERVRKTVPTLLNTRTDIGL